MNRTRDIAQSKSKKIGLVLQQLNSLPTLPAIAARLLQITVRSDTQANEVVRLIESDPALASKIIAMTSRASVGVSRHTISLSKAVVLLGFDVVRNAVLSIKVFETLARSDTERASDHFDRSGFWKHSLAVACASQMIIKHIDSRVDPEEAFVCGLLHDIGKVALDATLPKSFARIVQLTESSMGNIADYERQMLGLDHTIIGKRLAEKWNLPAAVIETIWLHHHWAQGLPESVANPAIVKTVHLADILAREQRVGYSGNHYLPHPAASMAEELNCPVSAIEQIARELREVISLRGTVLGLDDMEPEELYHEALTDANSELGKLNAKLQHQNQGLQLRNRYFQLLQKLNAEIRAGLSVVEVCRLITELWQKHTSSSCCAVYARTDRELIIEGALKPDPDEETSVFLVDRTDDPDMTSSLESTPAEELSAGFSVCPVGYRQNWFFEQVAPMFDLEHTVWMPLRVGNEDVGAVLWHSEKNETAYRMQLMEMEAFAASASLAIQQAQKQESQASLCEQLTQSNHLLQKAQGELLQKRSLAVVGEMACGAAHEINNPLAVICGRAQLLASTEEDDERRNTLENIARQGQEITGIITELMEFAKPSVPRPVAVPVRGLIDKAVKTQTPNAEAQSVLLELEIVDEIPDAFVDEEQIVSALSELISNAIDSYESQGGKVSIKADVDDLESEVILEIIDKGCGMDDKILNKAIEPFFSAKKAGRKRGLGLSRSCRQINTNGGHLQLTSKRGSGSVARLTLPVSQVEEMGEVAVS